MTENPNRHEGEDNLSNSESEDRLPPGFIEGVNSVLSGRATHIPDNVFDLIRDIKRIIKESHI
jgi:hypothetical protein